jgi:hypothetical protein
MKPSRPSRSPDLVGVVLLVCGAVACSGGAHANAVADGGGADTGAGTDDGGSQDSGTGDVDNGAPSTTYPAYQPPVPQLVVASPNGTVMPSPQVRPIYFPGDTAATDVDAFLSQWLPSAQWTAATHEYGIGPAALATPVMLTETAATTLTDADIQTWLQGKLDATNPAFGPVDGPTLANEIFMIFYPETTTVTAFGGTSCTDFSGYHTETAIGANKIAYVVLVLCPGDTTHDLELLSSAESLATAGDPFDDSQRGYASYDVAHVAWNTFYGEDALSELPTTCAFYDTDDDGGLPYALSWSNAAMAGYHQPCVPMADAGPYFASVPVMNDAVTFQTYQTYTTKGVLVPVGQSVAVEVQLLSDGPTSGPWGVSAAVMPSSGLPSTALSFAFDRDAGINGEKLHLTITANQAGATPFVVTSTLGTQQTFWAGIVAQN